MHPADKLVIVELQEVRKSWPTWQDAGQTGGDTSLSPETLVSLHVDGTVSVLNGGTLCPPFSDHPTPPNQDEQDAWAGLVQSMLSAQRAAPPSPPAPEIIEYVPVGAEVLACFDDGSEEVIFTMGSYDDAARAASRMNERLR